MLGCAHEYVRQKVRQNGQNLQCLIYNVLVINDIKNKYLYFEKVRGQTEVFTFRTFVLFRYFNNRIANRFFRLFFRKSYDYRYGRSRHWEISFVIQASI